jgi:hypothetical protein
MKDSYKLRPFHKGRRTWFSHFIKVGIRGIFIIPMLLLAGMSGCENAPINNLVNPTIANTTGAWSGEWVLYDDEIKTGGTVMMFATLEGQELDFSWQSNPYQGTKCIKYSWDGRDVTTYKTNAIEHDYVGFALIVADSVDKYDTVTRDLAPGGYTKISFRARGSLNTNVYLRLESNNGDYKSSGTNAWMSHTITGDWQRYEFPLSGSLAGTKDFVRVILRYDEDGKPDTPNTGRGNGGTVYIDDIRLER